MNSKNKVLIIDAMNLFTRHYVAHPAMNANGDQTGGVIGFLYELCRHIEEVSPSKTIVVWESGGSQKRRNILKEYKQGRRPAKLNRYYDEIPDTIANRNFQISLLIETIEKTGCDQIYVPDCEADDIIAYLSNYYFKDTKKVIVSADKDFYQLLSNNTVIYSPTWKRYVNKNTVLDKFGIHPNNFCLAKAIVGDKSDNIEGVKGVGFKFLSKYFPEFKEEKDLYLSDVIKECNEKINNDTKIKKYGKIILKKDIIKRNIKLMILDTGCLTNEQIKKVKFSIEHKEKTKDKLGTIRLLLKNGINNFNVDRLFLATRIMGDNK
jgi:DNA polymerase-1